MQGVSDYQPTKHNPHIVFVGRTTYFLKMATMEIHSCIPISSTANHENFSICFFESCGPNGTLKFKLASLNWQGLHNKLPLIAVQLVCPK